MAIEDNQEIRRTIQNLLPGTTYATRVRALNEFGQYSDWSEALEFTAEASGTASYDLVAPPAPTIQPQINALSIIMNYIGTNDGIALYKLYHSLDNVSFSLIATSQIGIYIHQVPPGVTHYYRFTITDIYGTESPVSPSNSGQSISALTFKPYATIVVASVESTAEGAENADFVCDGINDEVTLNAAALASGSGKVLLLEGGFYLSGIVNTYANTWEGQGPAATYIELVTDIPSGEVLRGDTVQNLSINGNSHTIEDFAVRASTSMTNCYFHDIDVYYSAFTSNFTTSCKFENITTTVGSTLIPNSEGMTTGNFFLYCTKALEMDFAVGGVVNGNYFDTCGLGIQINTNLTNITGNAFHDCTTAITADGDHHNITSNLFTGPSGDNNMAIIDEGRSLISGNTFYHCGVQSNSLDHIAGNRFYVGDNDRALHVKVNGGGMSFVDNFVRHDSNVSNPGIPPIRIDNSTSSVLIAHNNIRVWPATGAFSDAGINTNYGAGNYVNLAWIIPSSFETESDKFYEHTQGSANTTWTIVHNLEKFPTIVTVDTSGTVIHGTVTYNSNIQATVVFSSAVDGKAYCN